MVEINNQRKAFLDMLAWSEELITDVRKPKSWLCLSFLGGELKLPLLRSPSQTCHAKPQNSNQQAPDATSFFPVGGMPTASSLAWKTCRKSGRLWHCSRLSGAHLWLIVVISVRQSTVAAISGLHCRALVMVSSSIRLAWLQNSKKPGGRSEIDVWARVTAIISALVICIIVCTVMGC